MEKPFFITQALTPTSQTPHRSRDTQLGQNKKAHP